MSDAGAIHTPGPWRLGETRFGGRSRVVLSGNSRGYVCEVQCPTDLATALHEDERDANARLIAAAPELIAALERALNWLASYPGGCSGSAYDQARAALDKAYGIR